MSYIVTVKREKPVGPWLTFRCDNVQEAAALQEVFSTAYYPNVVINVVDCSRVADEFKEVDPV